MRLGWFRAARFDSPFGSSLVLLRLPLAAPSSCFGPLGFPSVSCWFPFGSTSVLVASVQLLFWRCFGSRWFPFGSGSVPVGFGLANVWCCFGPVGSSLILIRFRMESNGGRSRTEREQRDTEAEPKGTEAEPNGSQRDPKQSQANAREE